MSFSEPFIRRPVGTSLLTAAVLMAGALGSYYQSRSRFPEAEQQFRHAIDTDPKSAEPRAALARLYLAQGKKAETEEFLKQVKRDLADNSAAPA